MDDMVIRMARRAAADPFYLAFGLHHLAGVQSWSEEQLMSELGASPDTLAHARLCRTPRTDPAGMREDVARIAEKFGLNADVLAQAVRAGQAVELRREAEADVEIGTPMLAARDREADEPRPPGSGE